MKKMACAVLFAVMAVFSTAVFAEDVDPCASLPGSLTLAADGYYEIGTADALYKFACMVNNGAADINGRLTADIVVNENLLGTDNANVKDDGTFDVEVYKSAHANAEPKVWTPIGTLSTWYTGTFDGNGKTISGLYFNDKNAYYVGLFGFIFRGAVVQNVGVVDSYIRGSLNVGGVVGDNDGTVSNVYNTGMVSSEINFCGGVVGSNSGTGTVSNVYNTGTVSGGVTAGGVVGRNISTGTVSNVYNIGSVSGATAGGVVGKNDGTVSNVYNTGAVSGGGFGGGVVGDNGGTVSNVYNTGAVSGDIKVGGVVGSNSGTGTVSNVYNTGAVSGGSTVGGVVGSNDGSVNKGYYNTEVSCKNCSPIEGTIGKTTIGLASLTIGNAAADLPVLEGESPWEAGGFSYDKATGKLTASFPHLKNLAHPQYRVTILELKVVDNVNQIADADDLKNFARLVNEFRVADVAAELTADICLNACGEGESVLKADGTLNGDGSMFKQWVPILDYNGTFDGNGHTISGLYVNDENTDYVGFFGDIKDEAKIQNVGVEDSYFRGDFFVGGVVGSSCGGVSNVYNMGSVNGDGYVGGVVGENYGLVNNVYSTGAVSGEENVGGVVGVNIRSVSNVYNTGAVSGNNFVGGVVGYDGGHVENAYFNTDFFKGDALGYGREEPNIKGMNSAELATLDVTSAFENSDGVWNAGYSTTSNGWWKYAFPSLEGVGTAPTFIEIDPNATEVEISNVDELFRFAELVNAGNTTLNGKLTADIVVNENVLNDDGTLNEADTSKFIKWTPIGTDAYPFAGTFDGDGKTISGLYFNDESGFGGLFGILEEATVKNVGVVDSYFSGQSAIGAIAGLVADGEVSNVYSESAVSGGEFVGGVVGVNVGIISESYNKGSVNGYEKVGGIVGADVGKITDCYNMGSVKGSLDIGGVVGLVDDGGEVDKVYNMGAVSGEKFVGGVIGYNDASIVSNAYNTGSVSVTGNYVGGVVGGVDNKGSVSNVYNMGSVSGIKFTIIGGVVGFDNSAIISNAYFNTDFFTGNALGSGEDIESVEGKTSVELAAGATLKLDTAVWVVGAVSENAKQDTLYYPYLKVFGPHKYVLSDVKKYAITVAVNDKAMGTVTGAGEYEYGTEVEIAATAKKGYKFVKWSDGVKDAKRTITVTKAEKITATFEKDSKKDVIIAKAPLPQFSVTASGKIVSIAGARPNTSVVVYDLQGNMVKMVVATSANFTFTLPSAGVYIVKNGYTAKRVNVR